MHQVVYCDADALETSLRSSVPMSSRNWRHAVENLSARHTLAGDGSPSYIQAFQVDGTVLITRAFDGFTEAHAHVASSVRRLRRTRAPVSGCPYRQCRFVHRGQLMFAEVFRDLLSRYPRAYVDRSMLFRTLVGYEVRLEKFE